MAIQSLLPVYRMLGGDDTMMQNLLVRVKEDCGFRSWEWDEYLASARQRRRTRKASASTSTAEPDLPLFPDYMP